MLIFPSINGITVKNGWNCKVTMKTLCTITFVFQIAVPMNVWGLRDDLNLKYFVNIYFHKLDAFLNKIINNHPVAAISRMTCSTSVPLHLSSGVSPVLFLRRTSAPYFNKHLETAALPLLPRPREARNI